jgi:putative transcriptional regulator
MHNVIKWRLNEIMAAKRIKNKDLAVALGVTANSVYRLRKEDRMPRLDHERLNGLCKALQCTPSDLLVFFEDDEKVLSHA